jgi:hypothetical protein
VHPFPIVYDWDHRASILALWRRPAGATAGAGCHQGTGLDEHVHLIRDRRLEICRRVLTDLSSSGRVLVMNDEAHHAYRFPPDIAAARVEAEEIREATVWIDGLERIHRAREIVRAVDCSATPMFPSSYKEQAWTPFPWIVSDFALVDAIESGLVKIPRTPTEDNTGQAIPKYRRLWDFIKETLPKRSEAEEEAHRSPTIWRRPTGHSSNWPEPGRRPSQLGKRPAAMSDPF